MKLLTRFIPFYEFSHLSRRSLKCWRFSLDKTRITSKDIRCSCLRSWITWFMRQHYCLWSRERHRRVFEEVFQLIRRFCIFLLRFVKEVTIKMTLGSIRIVFIWFFAVFLVDLQDKLFRDMLFKVLLSRFSSLS